MPTLGIIGGGQLGSMLASAAKKLNIETIIFCDDKNAPGQKFSNKFICADYNDDKAISQFADLSDFITFEFENIPYETLNKINKIKSVFPHPSVNKIIQSRLNEKNFINKLNIRTTQYASIKKEFEIFENKNLLPGILKTCSLGYDGKGQYNINSINEIKNLSINYNNDYILEKFVKLKKRNICNYYKI